MTRSYFLAVLFVIPCLWPKLYFPSEKKHKQIPVWNEYKQECETVNCRLGLLMQAEKDSQNYQLNNVFNIAPIIY